MRRRSIPLLGLPADPRPPPLHGYRQSKRSISLTALKPHKKARPLTPSLRGDDEDLSPSPTPSPRLSGFRFPWKDYAAKHSETWFLPQGQMGSPEALCVAVPLPVNSVPLMANSLAPTNQNTGRDEGPGRHSVRRP